MTLLKMVRPLGKIDYTYKKFQQSAARFGVLAPMRVGAGRRMRATAVSSDKITAMHPTRHPLPKEINPRLLKSEPMQRCKLGECRGACCLYGVWLDRSEQEDILANAGLIQPHLAPTLRDPAVWFDGREEVDEFSASGQVVHSTVLPDRGHYGGTACVFLRDDFKCALQVAGEAAGMHPWRLKPFYCILHPLDLDEQGRINLDETAALVNEEGSCLRPADGLIALVETFEPELRYLLGDAAFRQAAGEEE